MADPLDGTVNLFGRPVKKGWVIGAGVVAGGVTIYYMRRKAASAAAAPAQSSAAPAGPTAAGDPYPPDGTTGNPSDPYSTDPATGMTYGDEANGGATGNGVSGLGGYYGNTSLYGAGTGYEQPGSFTSNAYWAQYVEQLMGSDGNDSISQAIGAYISGADVTGAGVSIIEQAIAVAGYPPVAGSGGYPPSINAGGSGAPATVAVPDVVGQTLAAAQAAISGAGLSYSGPSGTGTVASQSPASGTQVPAGSAVTVTAKTAAPAPGPAAPARAYTSGGHVVSRSNNDAVVAWSGHNAVRYVTVIRGPGKIDGHVGHTTIPQATYSGLEAGHDYVITVTPYNSAGQAGQPGNINLVTTR